MLSKMKSGMPLFTTLVMVSIATKLSGLSLRYLYVHHCQHLEFDVRHWVMISLSVVGLLAVIYHFLTNARPVYLVNFACYKPEDSCKCTKQRFMNCSSASGTFTEESLEFQRKVIDKSGLGDSTYLPEVLLTIPSSPSISMTQARAEAEAIIFGSVDQLFVKTNVNPKEIGILIVNCSLFCPTPSLSAMVVNHYKLRSNIMSYNIAGMGCSAGVISIELAQSLLQVHEASYALVVTAETAALNWYSGNERSMLVSNCLFRMGAAAILLSNKRSDKRRSKYQLLHTVRTHKGADDNSFTCVVQREDSEGNLGIALSKELMGVAGDALKANITSLGPLVLPISEKLQFLATLIGKKVFGMKKLKPYIPDFKLAFEHFCIHSGGKAVLDGVEKNLRLSKWHMEPSRMTLYRFGNTSSSSIWYELAYTEAKGRVKRGDRIWQIAFGSGFKCNSQVWKALRTVRPTQEKNPWMDEINSFPVDVPL